MTEPDLEEFKALTELEELRAALASTQLKLKRAKAKTQDLVEATITGAKEAMLALGPPPKTPAPRSDRRSRKAEVAVLLASDWHFGKETESFNTEVAQARVTLLAKRVEQIVAIERSDHPVRELHLLVNGDLVENLGIFPGQAWEVDSTTFDQMFAAAASLRDLIRTLLGMFERVHVWTQSGNHGRIGRKGDNPQGDNVDRMVYRIVQEQLPSGRLTWHEPLSWYSAVEIGDYRALLLHGHQIKSFGGNTPAFGILRKANAWASGVLGEPFTDVYMGHFHQAMVLPLANGRGRVFVNPSIESDSGYAKEFVAATGTPGQRLNFVDTERGRVTSERVLWLD